MRWSSLFVEEVKRYYRPFLNLPAKSYRVSPDKHQIVGIITCAPIFVSGILLALLRVSGPIQIVLIIATTVVANVAMIAVSAWSRQRASTQDGS